MPSQAQIKRLLLTGGGTGGHLFPAVATAQEFQDRYPGTEVIFVGTTRKIDTKSLENYGFESRTITCYGLKGKNILQLLKAVATLPVAYVQASRIIREFKPDVILGVGGYVTGPVVAAGKNLGVPTVIHEQNSIPGLANRKLGKIVDKICLSLPGSSTCFDENKTVYTGNPVRKKILELAKSDYKPCPDKFTLLVLGGSQGAQALNNLIPQALLGLSDDLRSRLSVIHQTGSMDVDEVRKAYGDGGIAAQVEPFFSDMDKVYMDTQLLISRAGATTLAEAAVLGIPAILIPYPYATDNHQLVNAKHYTDGGGALLFQQGEATPQLLQETVARLMEDSEALTRMAMSMKKQAYPDAHERIVACCMEVIEE